MRNSKGTTKWHSKQFLNSSRSSQKISLRQANLKKADLQENTRSNSNCSCDKCRSYNLQKDVLGQDEKDRLSNNKQKINAEAGAMLDLKKLKKKQKRRKQKLKKKQQRINDHKDLIVEIIANIFRRKHVCSQYINEIDDLIEAFRNEGGFFYDILNECLNEQILYTQQKILSFVSQRCLRKNNSSDSELEDYNGGDGFISQDEFELSDFNPYRGKSTDHYPNQIEQESDFRKRKIMQQQRYEESVMANSASIIRRPQQQRYSNPSVSQSRITPNSKTRKLELLSQIIVYIFALYVDLQRSSYQTLKILQNFLFVTEQDTSFLSNYFDLHQQIFEMVINSNLLIKEIFEDSFVTFALSAEEFESEGFDETKKKIFSLYQMVKKQSCLNQNKLRAQKGGDDEAVDLRERKDCQFLNSNGSKDDFCPKGKSYIENFLPQHSSEIYHPKDNMPQRWDQTRIEESDTIQQRFVNQDDVFGSQVKAVREKERLKNSGILHQEPPNTRPKASEAGQYQESQAILLPPPGVRLLVDENESNNICQQIEHEILKVHEVAQRTAATKNAQKGNLQVSSQIRQENSAFCNQKNDPKNSVKQNISNSDLIYQRYHFQIGCGNDQQLNKQIEKTQCQYKIEQSDKHYLTKGSSFEPSGWQIINNQKEPKRQMPSLYDKMQTIVWKSKEYERRIKNDTYLKECMQKQQIEQQTNTKMDAGNTVEDYSEFIETNTIPSPNIYSQGSLITEKLQRDIVKKSPTINIKLKKYKKGFSQSSQNRISAIRDKLSLQNSIVDLKLIANKQMNSCLSPSKSQSEPQLLFPGKVYKDSNQQIMNRFEDFIESEVSRSFELQRDQKWKNNLQDFSIDLEDFDPMTDKNQNDGDDQFREKTVSCGRLQRSACASQVFSEFESGNCHDHSEICQKRLLCQSSDAMLADGYGRDSLTIESPSQLKRSVDNGDQSSFYQLPQREGYRHFWQLSQQACDGIQLLHSQHFHYNNLDMNLGSQLGNTPTKSKSSYPSSDAHHHMQSQNLLSPETYRTVSVQRLSAICRRKNEKKQQKLEESIDDYSQFCEYQKQQEKHMTSNLQMADFSTASKQEEASRHSMSLSKLHLRRVQERSYQFREFRQLNQQKISRQQMYHHVQNKNFNRESKVNKDYELEDSPQCNININFKRRNFARKNANSSSHFYGERLIEGEGVFYCEKCQKLCKHFRKRNEEQKRFSKVGIDLQMDWKSDGFEQIKQLKGLKRKENCDTMTKQRQCLIDGHSKNLNKKNKCQMKNKKRKARNFLQGFGTVDEQMTGKVSLEGLQEKLQQEKVQRKAHEIHKFLEELTISPNQTVDCRLACRCEWPYNRMEDTPTKRRWGCWPTRFLLDV